MEERSIYIMREAKSNFKNVAALWSMGKDSTTMLALARKAFHGKVPFPVIHIDNGIDFPEILYPALRLTEEGRHSLLQDSIQQGQAEEHAGPEEILCRAV